MMASLLLTDWEEVEPAPASPELVRPDFVLSSDRDAKQQSSLRHIHDKSLVEAVPAGHPVNSISPDGKQVLAYKRPNSHVIRDRPGSRSIQLPPDLAGTPLGSRWSDDGACAMFIVKDQTVSVFDRKSETIIASWKPAAADRLSNPTPQPQGSLVAFVQDSGGRPNAWSRD